MRCNIVYVRKIKDKYVFFDVDGTLSEYRYNDILYGGKCPELGCQSLEDFLFGELFYKARPLKTMQKIIENLDSDKIFILGAVVTNNEIEQKYKWLNENYPKIKRENMFFINSTMLKPEAIIEYSRHFNIPLEKIVFVDDRLDVLRKAEEYGIALYHPSSFME